MLRCNRTLDPHGCARAPPVTVAAVTGLVIVALPSGPLAGNRFTAWPARHAAGSGPASATSAVRAGTGATPARCPASSGRRSRARPAMRRVSTAARRGTCRASARRRGSRGTRSSGRPAARRQGRLAAALEPPVLATQAAGTRTGCQTQGTHRHSASCSRRTSYVSRRSSAGFANSPLP